MVCVCVNTMLYCECCHECECVCVLKLLLCSVSCVGRTNERWWYVWKRLPSFFSLYRELENDISFSRLRACVSVCWHVMYVVHVCVCVCVRIVYMVRLCLFTWACRYFEIIVFIAFNGKLSSTHNHCHLVEVIDITCDSVSIETKIELYFRRSNFSQWMNGVCAYHFSMIFMIYGKTTSSLTRTRFLHMLLDTRTHSHRTSHISHHTCESMSEHSNCTTIFSNFTF